MANLSFAQTLERNHLQVQRTKAEVLQINIGRVCNLACHHCHVESGPKRKENMVTATVERVIALLEASPGIHTVDLTGGAPELNPGFRDVVRAARRLGKRVIDRCNLTVLFEPGQADTAQFLADQGVEIVASLPCYTKDNVEKQRGRGVFGQSIEALQMLNKLGYAQPGTGLTLDLVYNPLGASLPPAQAKLESDYHEELQTLFDIRFNHLFTITNMPIKRFLKDLERSNKLETYMELLANSFNPMAAKGVMCRNLISVAWNGELFDCDFNQMLEMPMGGKKTTLWDIQSFDQFSEGKIAFANHCYACTAGSGSSCGGAIT